MNLFTSGKIVNYSREKRYLLDHAQYITKKVDCFEQRYDYHFGEDANININSDEGDHVWQNSGETEEESCNRQLKSLGNMISRYGGDRNLGTNN